MRHELGACYCQRQAIFYAKADLPLADELLRPRLPPPSLVDEQQRVAAEVCRLVLGESAVEVEPLSEHGTFHTLYRVVLAGGRRRVVRFNALADHHRDFPLLLDAAVMPRLRAAGLPSLAVDHVDLSRRWCPWDYEILEHADGTALKALDPDDTLLMPLLRKLGEVVARLHEIRTDGFGLFDLRPLAEGSQVLCGTRQRWSDYLTVRLAEHVARCSDLGAMTASEVDAVLRLFDGSASLFDDVAPCLLHGDLGNHNVFTDGTAITALIDWEDSLSGDPIYDIAFWATFHPERRHAAFLDGYRTVRPLPEDFDVRFWLYFLRVALAKTLVRHRLGLADLPGRPPAALRIRKALNRLAELQMQRC